VSNRSGSVTALPLISGTDAPEATLAARGHSPMYDITCLIRV
jgi:hypothetical protein